MIRVRIEHEGRHLGTYNVSSVTDARDLGARELGHPSYAALLEAAPPAPGAFVVIVQGRA